MIYFLFLLALFLSELLYFRIADHFNIIDKPNQRSSHTKITLRGGGIVFVFGYLLYFVTNQLPDIWFTLGLLLIAIISFADDIKPRDFKLRLVFHFSGMALMFYQLGLFSLPWYYTILAFVLCTGVLNAYNFMDGINGITGLYSMVVLGSLLYINQFVQHFVDANLIYMLLLSLLVFNFFNFRKKAKCFAGDVGAISIAFVLVFLIGKLIIVTGNFSYIGLLAVYGVDSILTIVHRLKLKENIFEAHRKHLFQIMANEMKIPQLVVSLVYGALQLLISIGFILFSGYEYWYILLVLIVLSVVYIVIKKRYFHLHITQ